MDTTFKIILTLTIVGEQSGNVYRKTTDEEPNLDPSEVMAYGGKVFPAIVGAISELGPMFMGVVPVKGI